VRKRKAGPSVYVRVFEGNFAAVHSGLSYIQRRLQLGSYHARNET